jgi:serine/threonine protein phosphatase PrpC
LQAISAMFQKEATPELPDVAAFLASALLAAHRHILHYSIEKGLLDTPRTTIVAAVAQAGAVTWIHCGDSRLYLVRQGELLARTRDHSFLEQRQAAAAGLKLPAHSNRNILFTCLGSPTKPVFDITGPVALQQGDKLMLCSDGLWSSLNDADIAYQLGHKPVSEAVPDLVEKALSKAGDSSDNVTCIAFEWETPDGFESTRGSISTDTVSDGVFASTVQAGWFDPSLEEMDDDAIERSIAEINEAIRRSAAKKS